MADFFSEQLISIAEAGNTAMSYSLRKGESLGVVFPVYSWGPPPLVLDFLKKLNLSEKPEYLYFVCTCGDDTGKTARVLQNAIAQKGWKFKAGYSIIMPNTYICMPGFDVDTPQIVQKKLEEAEIRIRDIAERLVKRATEFDCNEGGIPWIKTYFIRPLFNRFAIAPRKFRATSACITCGKCAKVCPVQNIYLAEGRPVWGKHCTMCLACYHHCPVHAVSYGNQTTKKGQYIHPNFRAKKFNSK